eukprot:sb/3476599/
MICVLGVCVCVFAISILILVMMIGSVCGVFDVNHFDVNHRAHTVMCAHDDDGISRGAPPCESRALRGCRISRDLRIYFGPVKKTNQSLTLNETQLTPHNKLQKELLQDQKPTETS